MRCPFCHQAIKPEAAWKSAGGRFYCSEFCADSEIAVPLRRHAVPKHEIDRQYLERLGRLLPLRRAMQEAIEPAAQTATNQAAANQAAAG